VGSGAALAGKRILAVEDNEFNRQVVRELLQRAGGMVVEAVHGREALAKVEREGPFDLILMDVQMPVMDGLEASRRLRGRAGLPLVVAMTANVTPEDRARCREAGMAGFIPKPIDPARFAATVAAWCAGTSTEEPISAPAPVSQHAPVAPSVPAPTPVSPPTAVAEPAPAMAPSQSTPDPASGDEAIDAGFDPAAVRALTGDDDAMLRLLVAEFVRSAQGVRDDLARALSVGDLAQVGAVAHRYKSAAGQVGAHGLQQLAATLERTARGGASDALAVSRPLGDQLIRLSMVLDRHLQLFLQTRR
jgi:CheY-like chemotaxis protein/HPt (histidine-containing phosphotransfer) domain-containing protein